MAHDVDAILAAYVECALWSSVDFGDDPDDSPECFDAWATVDDIAPETMATMRADVVDFLTSPALELPGAAWWDDEQLGHDFWLTRNGHGAGFWDRHYGDTDEARAGDALSDAAKVYGSVDLYRGDDGKVWA